MLSARVAEAEAKLSFTVLADLLEPVAADVLTGLPPPQQRALRAALLLDDGEGSLRPDARAVSLGALGSVQALASRGPITVAIDDVQWTDTPSARALAFCLRRLVNEPVTVLAARRLEPGLRDPLDLVSTVRDHRRLTLGPLDVAATGAILRRRLERRFPEPLVARIHAASRGNPLFALELGRTIDVDAAPAKAGEPLPVPQELQAVLRERLRNLPDEARNALLIAAASASPTVDMLEGSGHAVDRLVDAGIVGLRGPVIEFAHPLFASTVYASAGAASRRAAHRRLAEIATDPEGRARHLALSSSEPSEEVAAALDRAARHARARGAPESAAELCELALAATRGDDVEARAARAKSLAGNLFDAGDPPRAREILERTIVELPPGPSRAEALGLLSQISWRDLHRVEALLAAGAGGGRRRAAPPRVVPRGPRVGRVRPLSIGRGVGARPLRRGGRRIVRGQPVRAPRITLDPRAERIRSRPAGPAPLATRDIASHPARGRRADRRLGGAVVSRHVPRPGAHVGGKARRGSRDARVGARALSGARTRDGLVRDLGPARRHGDVAPGISTALDGTRARP